MRSYQLTTVQYTGTTFEPGIPGVPYQARPGQVQSLTLKSKIDPFDCTTVSVAYPYRTVYIWYGTGYRYQYGTVGSSRPGPQSLIFFNLQATQHVHHITSHHIAWYPGDVNETTIHHNTQTRCLASTEKLSKT